MARIRSIKPDFWTDGDVVALSYAARLLFIGSWNFALCDYGHVADDAVRLKMQVLPADDVDAQSLIDELVASGRMVRLVGSDGRTYLHVKRFTEHQRIEKRWTPRCPACLDSVLTEAPQTSHKLARVSESTREHAQTLANSAPERRGEEGKVNTPSSADADGAFNEWWALYPRKVGKAEARKAWTKAVKASSVTAVQAGLKAQLPTIKASEERFRPHPATWLNQGRWEDEPTTDVDQPSTGWWNAR